MLTIPSLPSLTMASIIRDIKEKLSTSKGSSDQPTGDSSASPQQGGQEQNFSILPHPAKSNDPADLQRETGGGLQSSQGAFSAFTSAPGPVVPNQEMLNNVSSAKTSEELNELQAQLNK